MFDTIFGVIYRGYHASISFGFIAHLLRRTTAQLADVYSTHNAVDLDEDNQSDRPTPDNVASDTDNPNASIIPTTTSFVGNSRTLHVPHEHRYNTTQESNTLMTSRTYQVASGQLLRQAREELATGDVRQASEKGWGAAAQIVQAIAARRDWEHPGHRELFRAVDRLRKETGDPDVRRLFDVASALHVNFYEDWRTSEARGRGPGRR